MANKRFDYVIGFSADTSKLSSALKQLEVQLNKIATGKISGNFGIEQIREASSAATQLGAHLKAAINVDTGKLDISKFARSLHSSNTTLSSLSASLTKVSPAGQVAFMNIARAITEAEMPLKRSNELMNKLWITMKNTVRWQITSGFLTGFTGAIGDAYRYAEDLNESLNNIRIVTGKSTAEMAQFAKQANRAAKELNTTTTKYTDASLIYYQQGLDDKQVKARTDVTAKFANVSRENLTTSSEYLTAIWNNFAKGSKNLEYFADVIVALGAATASSSQEIATGLNKFAATAETVGLSYEYATSALATVTATTRQSAEVVGTAFKTLFSRIQDLELGKTLDDGTTLGKYSKALDAVGVSIKDSNGELRDMDRILDDIGGKWDTLNKDEQVALAQAVGGVRQYTQFIALMDNWDFMKENLETAKGATGELQKQADIFAESWEAARKNVKASAEGIYDSLIKDEFWIGLTNGFADGLKSVELFADSIGGLKGVLALATIAMNKLVGPKVAQSIRDVAYNIGILTGKEKEHTIALKESALAEIKKYANSQGNFASDKNEILFYQQLGQYQLDLNKLMEGYNAEQVESVQHLLEQVQAAQNLAIELSKAAKAASNESQIFVDSAGEDLFKQGSITTMGGRNFVTYSDRYKSGTEYLQAAEETAYQRTQAQSIKELLKSKSFSWKGQKNQLLTAFGLDPKTTKKDFKAYVDNLIKTSEEEMARLTKESRFFGSNVTGKSSMNLFSEAQERGATRGSARAQQIAGYIDAGQLENDVISEIPKFTDQTDDFAASIVKAGTALSSLSIAWSSFQSLGRVFSDEDLTAGERLQTLFMSLGMLLPSLSSGLKAISTSKLVDNISKGVLGNLTVANTGVNIGEGSGLTTRIAKIFATKELAKVVNAHTGALTQEATAQIAANSAMKASLTTLGLWTLAIAAVGLGIYALAEAIETTAEKTKHLQEQQEQLKTQYDEARNSITELKSSFKQLDDLGDTLKSLTQGTEEWQQNLQDINFQVLQLLEKYPELAGEIENVNGKLTISAAGQERFIEAQQNRANDLAKGYYAATMAKNRQDYENAVTDFRADRLENSGKFVASEAVVKKVVQEVANGNSAILGDRDALSNLLGGMASGEVLDFIQENTTELQNLAVKLQANTESQSLLAAQFVEANFGEEAKELSTGLSKLYASNEKQYVNQARENGINGLSKQKVIDWYSENVLGGAKGKKTGIGGWGDSAEFYDSEGKSLGTFSYEAMREAMASQQGMEDFSKIVEPFIERYKDLDKTLLNTILGLSSGDIDINELDQETFQKLKSLWGDKLISMLNELGENGAQVIADYNEKDLLGQWNETYHNRIEYLGSDLGKALNARDDYLKQLNEYDKDQYNDIKLRAELDPDSLSDDEKQILADVNRIVDNLSENADKIKLSINSSLRQDVDEAFDIGRDFDALQEKIANGLEMTTEDVVSLIDSGYGELLRDCEANADATISLNQSVVDAYVQQKKDEVEADRQAKIAQLETQREMLVVQEKALQEKKRLLIAATQAETDAAAAGYMAQAMMQQVIADDAALQAAGVVDADTAKSQALTENAKAVAEYTTDTLNTTTLDAINSNVSIDTSTHNLATNVVNYWNTMARAKANYFNITEKNASKFSAVSPVDPAANVQTGYSGSEVKGFDTSKLSDADAVAKQIEKWTTEIDKLGTLKDIQDAASSLIAGTDNELKAVGAQIGAIDAALARLRSGNLINSTVGGGKGGSDTAKELKEVLERYHEITREIEYQKELLNDISTAADRAYGTDKIEMLTQKIEKLNKVAELQSQKQAAAAAFVASDLEALRANGLSVEYDTASMELKNYTQLLQQITDEYNSRINSVSKDQQDMVQKEYDDKMQLLENYEDSIDTFREQLNAYEDAMRQIEDAKLEKVKEALQIRIDWKEIQDTLREFQKEINESIGDALDNGVRNAGLNAQGVKDEISMFADYETKMNSLLDMIRNANQYTDVQALQDELADLRKELVDSGSAMLDYIETLKETLPDALDAAADRFEEFISMLESNMGVLDAMNDLIDLQTINNSLADKYAMLSKTYNATLENSLTQAKLQKQYMERAETQLHEAEIALANATQGTAEYDILKANRDALLEDYQEAQDAMLEATAQAMEAAKNIYSNALDDIFYEFENKMTRGLGFDQLQAKYNRTKDEDNRFLDGVNRFVETQDLNNKVQESIAKASTDYAKSTLKALQDEFAERQANADLSEYDLKIMEAKYNMTLKQIALEEAQNAKNKVRLVRGANGNYNYLFTADEADINSKQQEYLKAMQDYYNIAKDQTENITGEIISLWQEMSEEIRKIYEDDTLNAEQRQNAINEIQAYYQKKYADLAKMQTDAAKDMKDAGNSALAEQQKAANKYGDDTSETAQNFQKNFQRILEEMGGNANDFNSAYSDQLINLVAIEGSFTETTAEMFAKLNEALTKYKGNIGNISNEIGVSYDQLSDKVDRLTQANKELRDKATSAIDEIWNKISELQDVTEAQAAWTKEIYNTIAAIQKLASETATAVQKYNEAVGSINRLGATGSWNGGAGSGGSGTGTGGNVSGNISTTTPSTPNTSAGSTHRIRKQLGQFDPSSRTYKLIAINGGVYEGGGWWNYPSGMKRQIESLAADYSRSQLKHYDTGGYTGDWGSDGRLAVLHQKELVLNQEDTKNMLAAVQSIRELAPSMIAEMRARISGAAIASQSLFGSRYSGMRSAFDRKATELAQSVQINADFPGVRDAIEIKEALESLVQTSAQRINFYTK